MQAVAVVTGGSAGIGFAIAETLARSGNHVIMVARDPERGAVAETKLSRLGLSAEFFQQDVSDWSAAEAVFDHADSAGEPTVLVNSASTKPRIDLLGETKESWDEEVNSALRSSFRFAQELIKRLKESGAAGSIVNVGSVSSHMSGSSKSPAYHVAKAGLRGLTSYLAVCGPRAGAAVRTNCVEPGHVLLDRDRDRFYSKENEEYRSLFESINPLASSPSEYEVAAVVAFLCSDFAKHISGATIVLDGGSSLRDQYDLATKLKGIDI